MDLKLESGEEEYDRLIAPLKKLCKFITIWSLDLGDVGGDLMKLKKARTLQNCHKVFIFVYMSIIFAGQLADAVRKWGDMETFTEACITASSCILTLFRLSMYSIQKEKLSIILDRMRADWVSASDKDRAILRKKCGPAFVMSNYFTVCIAVTMSLFFTSPTLVVILTGSNEWSLPFGGYFFVDITKSPTYEILYVIKIIGGTYGLINVAAVNGFNLISVIHASAKFHVLQSHLTDLKSDSKISVGNLRSYIYEHQMAIEFADILEEVINKVALGQFIVSTGLVCFAGLQITELLDDKIHLASYAIYLTAAIFELFLFSYSGYHLTLESELVGDSAFNSNWVGSPFTKDLNIVMMRSTKPSKITAAKFYDMSLENFATVLSTSFSYFTTLRAMNE